MKTNLYSKIWLTLSICLIQNLHSQNTTAKNETIAACSPKQIRVQLGAKTNPVKEELNYKPEIANTLPERMELQAQELKQEAEKVTNPEDRKIIQNEAENLYNLAIRLEIEAYELSGIKNRAEYKENAIEIKSLQRKSVIDMDAHLKISNLIIESERNLKLATEMREEAHAEKQAATLLGRLSNADEKEVMALCKQKQVIGILGNQKPLILSMR